MVNCAAAHCHNNKRYWTKISPTINQNNFQETNHVTFQKQPFQEVLQNECS